MNDEFSLHIEMETERLVQEEGLAGGEARRRALVAFGSVERHKDEIRNGRGVQLLEDLLADARYAVRMMRRSPILSGVIVLTLALAIGATVGIFGLLYSTMLRRLPLPSPSELYAVQPMNGGQLDGIDLRQLEELRETERVPAIAGHHYWPVTIRSQGAPEDVWADFVTPDFFDVLGASPQLGRTFTTDGSEAVAPVTVISAEVWRRHFNADPQVVGRTLEIGGTPFTVIGVMPEPYEGIHFARRFAIAIPFESGQLVGWQNQRVGLQLVTRVSSPGEAAELERLLTQVYRDCCAGPAPPPASGAVPAAAGRQPTARPPRHDTPFASLITTGDTRPHVRLVDASRGLTWSSALDVRKTYGRVLMILMLGVVTLLIAASANVGGLMMARAANREREFGIRLSIGAAKGRVVRQVLTESVILAGLGAVLGYGLAWISTDLIINRLPEGSERLAGVIEWKPSGVLIGATTALVVLSTLFFGSAPAWRAGRTDPRVPMAGDRSGAGGRKRLPTAQALVAIQVGIGIVLIFGASVFVASMRNLTVFDRGIHADQLLLARLASGEGEGPIDPGELLDLLSRNFPGYRSAIVLDAPLVMDVIMNYPVRHAGEQPAEMTGFRANAVSPGYFSVTGINRIHGREFTEDDVATGTQVAIVSRALARRIFGEIDPSGRTMMEGTPDGEREVTIVGVVDDIPYEDPRTAAPEVWYRPVSQSQIPQTTYTILLRAPEAEDLVSPVRQVLVNAFPGTNLLTVRPLQWILEDQLSKERLAAALSAAFGAVAALLVGIGVYGLLNNLVTRRRRELAIRASIGASRTNMVTVIARQATIPLAIGLSLGIPLTLLASSLVRSQVHGIDPAAPGFSLVAFLVILLMVVLATAIPCLRLRRLDPAEVLRMD